MLDAIKGRSIWLAIPAILLLSLLLQSGPQTATNCGSSRNWHTYLCLSMTLNADRRLEVGDHVELLVTAHNAGNEMSSGELLRLVSFGGRIDFDASVDNRQVMPRELHREGGTVWYYPIRLPRLAAGQKSELKLFGRIIGAGRALLSVRTEEEDENGNLSFLLENFGQILGRRVSSNEPTERFLEVRRACVAQHGETNRQLLRDCVARELKPSRG